MLIEPHEKQIKNDAKGICFPKETFLSKTQEFPSPVLKSSKHCSYSSYTEYPTYHHIIFIHKFHNIWLRVMASLTISPQNFILFVAIVHFMKLSFVKGKFGLLILFLLLLSSSTVRHTQTQSNSIKFSLSSLSAELVRRKSGSLEYFFFEPVISQHYVEKFNNKMKFYRKRIKVDNKEKRKDCLNECFNNKNQEEL